MEVHATQAIQLILDEWMNEKQIWNDQQGLWS